MGIGSKKIKLGELLLRAGVISEEQLQTALAEQKKWGGKLGSLLVELKFLDEETLVRALSRQLGLPRVDFSGVTITPEALAALPADFVVKNQVLPLSLDTARKLLVVAMADPSRLNLLDEIGFMTGMKVQVAIAGEKALAQTIKRHFRSDEEIEPPSSPDLSPALVERISKPPPTPAAEGAGATPAKAAASTGEIIEQIRQLQAQQAQTLRFLVQLLLNKGVFSLEEYRLGVERERGA